MVHMKPEILAPVQDEEALAAAVGAGADSVYLGLQEMTARQRGRNFTLPALAQACAWCRSRDVKVYVALNTVVKQHELPRLCKFLASVNAQGADGVIVQDLGVATLVHEHFPKLMLHASTQCAVHSLEGVKEAARLGFDRVILARELTASEVQEIAADSPIELEIFVHGSYCFSFSGLCLTSSFLGGFSGNRGWCTQACRRPYFTQGRKSALLFSMADFSMANNGELLRSLPVSAWKIEGRMKYPEYVSATVRAYRMIRDGGSEKDAKAILKEVKTRPFSDGYLGMAGMNELTRPETSGYTGTFAGKIRRAARETMELVLQTGIEVGQKLRVQDASGSKGKGVRVKWIETVKGRKLRRAGRGDSVRINAPLNVGAGDMVFRVEQKRGRPPKFSVTVKPWQGRASRAEKKLLEAVARAPQLPEAPAAMKTELTLETDDVSLARSAPNDVHKVVLFLTGRMLHSLRPQLFRKKKKRCSFGVSIPPVVLPGRRDLMRDALKQLIDAGVDFFEVNNAGHWDLLPAGATVQAGPWLYVHNAPAADCLLRRGARSFVLPFESDMETARKLSEKGLAPVMEVVLYGFIPLFMSRAEVKVKKGGAGISDAHGDRFLLKRRDGLTWLYGLTPYCAFSYRKTFMEMGIQRFRISITGKRFAASELPSLVGSYKKCRDTPSSMPFNLQKGLK